MFSIIADYLRSQGWRSWDLLQVESTGQAAAVIWWIFGAEHRFPTLVAKMSRPWVDPRVLQWEAAALERLEPISEEVGIPRLLFQSKTRDGRLLVIQSGVPGQPFPDEISTCDRVRLSTRIAQAETWLETFQSRVPPQGTMAHSMEQVIRLCRERLLQPAGEELKLLDVAQKALPDLADVPAVPVHGDFWSFNILDDRARLWVIDWSSFHYGAPTEDLHNFVAGLVYRRQPSVEESARNLWEPFFGKSPISELTKSATARILNRQGLGWHQLRPLFLLFLISRLAGTGFANHSAWRVCASRYMREGMPLPCQA